MQFIIIFIILFSSSFATEKLTKLALGEKLFFDTIISKNKTQSCATCHNPEHGFIDNRINILQGAVSLGDDGKSFGNRNAPTASYAKFSPDFHFKNNKAIGGQFLDGREKDLQAQAGGPPLNPIEMGMANKEEIKTRLQEKYFKEFTQIFGANAFDDTNKFYSYMTEAIAVFEKSKFFNKFDSKYDRYLAGTYQLTRLEDLGKSLFFSNNNTNCSTCHQLRKNSEAKRETFTNYEYHNIGVPKNKNLDVATDFGLFHNTKKEKDKGKFKVPTLRNIAVTAPYMHNGVFKELRTVILFYDKYVGRNNSINPETNKPWESAEVEENINFKDLRDTKRLRMMKVAALIAFLETLTDKNFEHLIK